MTGFVWMLRHHAQRTSSVYVQIHFSYAWLVTAKTANALSQTVTSSCSYLMTSFVTVTSFLSVTLT